MDEDIPKIVENFYTDETKSEPESEVSTVPIAAYRTEEGLKFEIFQGGRYLSKNIQYKRES